MLKYQKLYDSHENRINDSRLFQRSFNSALYQNKWKEAGVDISKLKGYHGLRSLPFISADDLRITWENNLIEDIILTESVSIWYTTSGSMGNKKWIPWTFNDYKIAAVEIAKIIVDYVSKAARVLSIVLPPPFLSGITPFKIIQNSGELGSPLEVLAFAPEYIQDGFTLLMKRKPTTIVGTPSLTLRMAEEIAINTPKILGHQAEMQKSTKLRMASLATKVKKIYPKNIFKEMTHGFFGGESLDPFRKAIEDKWGIEAFDFFAFTEGFSAGFECSEHNGMHFQSTNAIMEIIPEKELEKEEKDPNYIPEAILFSEAEEGLIGEMVITDFKEALPMIRYRVRDSIKIITTEECSCGVDGPKVKILGRTDSVINLGIIRLSANIFDQLLRKKFQSGKVHLWEVLVTREKYRPKIILTVEPEFVKNEEEFKKDLYKSLYSFDIFQRGIDNDLFIFDEIKLTNKLKLEIYGQGKSRFVRYHSDFYKEIKI